MSPIMVGKIPTQIPLHHVLLVLEANTKATSDIIVF